MSQWDDVTHCKSTIDYASNLAAAATCHTGSKCGWIWTDTSNLDTYSQIYEIRFKRIQTGIGFAFSLNTGLMADFEQVQVSLSTIVIYHLSSRNIYYLFLSLLPFTQSMKKVRLASLAKKKDNLTFSTEGDSTLTAPSCQLYVNWRWGKWIGWVITEDPKTLWFTSCCSFIERVCTGETSGGFVWSALRREILSAADFIYLKGVMAQRGCDFHFDVCFSWYFLRQHIVNAITGGAE